MSFCLWSIIKLFACKIKNIFTKRGSKGDYMTHFRSLHCNILLFYLPREEKYALPLEVNNRTNICGSNNPVPKSIFRISLLTINCIKLHGLAQSENWLQEAGQQTF